MIANADELAVAIRNIQILEEAVKALRDQLSASNPQLLQATEGAYLRRIETLKSDVEQYAARQPTRDRSVA